MLLRDRAEDVFDRLVLVDPTVGGTAQEPEPRTHRRLVFVHPQPVANLRELGDIAMEDPWFVRRGRMEQDRDRGTEDLVRRQVPLFTLQAQVEVEQLAQALGAGDVRGDDVGPKRALELQHTILIGCRHVAVAGFWHVASSNWRRDAPAPRRSDPLAPSTRPAGEARYLAPSTRLLRA